MTGREKEIIRYVFIDDLDRLLHETDSEKVSKRITLVKRLYKGATVADAADDIGKFHGAASNWACRWNEGGLGKLTPNFGGGQPPKLDQAERDELSELLREDQPWKKQEIQQLLNDEFKIEYHPNYLPTFLDELGLHYAIPRTKRPDRPENAEEILGDPHNKQEGDEEDEDWETDAEICTDSGTVVGFSDISYPQPWDNSQRVYSVDKPHIERPLVRVDTPAAGFSALNGTSVLSFPPDQTKEEICACLETTREQNPRKRKRILLV